MKKVGIGIIGLDHWYWALGAAYSAVINPKAELIAIADPSEEVKKISKIYGAQTYYLNYYDLIKDARIEGVIVTTTTSQHHEVAISAAESGKHILVGKPIARTLKEADAIVRAAEKSGVKLMAMAAGPMPGDPLKNIIDQGIIGDPFAAYCSLLAIPPLRAPGINEPGWFVDPTKAAGGGFIDHAVYDVALLRKYFNSEVERVYAEMGKFIHKEYEVEDHGMALIRFKDKSLAFVESSFTGALETHGRKIIVGTEGEVEMVENRITVWSKKESYNRRTSIEFRPPPLVFSRTYVEVSVPTPPFAEVYKPTIDEFINCILEDREPIATGKDARAVLEVMLACYLSAKERKPVELPLREDIDVIKILKEI